ncbi:GTP-binding protein [Streptomyces tsukubensis]|uniref:ATP-binding protein n=1 Tax=Streptomyces tsukubensis TaxID=83656 RepID=A0A1V4A0Q6_9ACTN|nr:ATP/GTP-binding protein [Streptomyces tsukubensis]OON72428.1 hypothetical protein B1H18_29800 [Streptomyces tsukubensis]QFR96958.1 ATP-binding protein [Streptomyces tsukubensis]
MGCEYSENREGAGFALKILVSGGVGAGKTTLVSALSGVRPPLRMSTEDPLGQVHGREEEGGGDRSATTALLSSSEFRTVRRRAARHPVRRPATPTVTLDFGRIVVRPGLSLQLFGAPGHARLRQLWDDLAQEALGAVVVVDPTCPAECLPAVEHVQERRIPFVLALNSRRHEAGYHPQDISRALDLRHAIPVLACDARLRIEAAEVLARLVEHAGHAHHERLSAPVR